MDSINYLQMVCQLHSFEGKEWGTIGCGTGANGKANVNQTFTSVVSGWVFGVWVVPLPPPLQSPRHAALF